ncbi:MAG: hypothetical protein E3K37_18815 [Candidatus Kuenenia sp.]|nr:hypothetical protein [Candidatus Kuenenia hertensis]
MGKRKLGVIASAFVAGALVCGSTLVNAEPVMTGGPVQGKALWTDYCGMSKEVQGPVNQILFTQSPRTVKGDPYQNYPHYIPEGSRIALYDLNTRELKVLTNDFATAFDPCTYWDGKKFAFAGVHKKGGGCQIWEMNIDGTGLRQMTDLKGSCRSPIYYAAGSIEEGKGRIIWRDRYFEGDWKEHGEVEKTGMIIFAGSPEGVMDEFHNPYAYNLYRLDTQGGKIIQRITGHVLSGIEFPHINTTIDQITYNVSSDFDPWLTPDGNILFSSVQANGSRAEGKGRVMICADNWDGAYPRPIYGNCDGEIGGASGKSQAKITFGDRKLVYVESPYMNWGVGQLAAVSWDAPFNKTYERLTGNDGGLYRSPYPLPDDRMLVSYAERGDFGIYWFDFNKGGAGDQVYDDPNWNEHQPAPIYVKYKPRWINTFTAGDSFGVTTVTYQPFDQVKVEGYPHSWGTWICFDTTLTDLPVGPYPHQRAKEVGHGDIKAVRIIQGYQCVEPDSTRFRVGAGAHLVGGCRSSSNSGSAFQQRGIIGYQYVEDDGSTVTSQLADVPYYIQILDDKGMSVQTGLSWAYLRPYHGRICTGCHYGSYRGRAFKNLHSKALYNWWYDDRSHYDSPFAFRYLKFDDEGNYKGVKHGEDIVVPSDIYYGGPSGTTSQPVEGLRLEMQRTVDFRRDIQPILDAKCAKCHDANNPPNLSGGLELVSVDGIAAYSRAYNSLLASQRGKDPNIGGKYVNPSAAINSLLVWRLYEEALSANPPRDNVFPIEGRVLHDKFLTQAERFAIVEWIDLGAQWDNIPGPDFYPGYHVK